MTQTIAELRGFLEERRQGIGGSDAAVVAGLDPEKSRVQLWREKRGEIVDMTDENGPMRRGKALEPMVRGMVATAGFTVREMPGLYHAPRGLSHMIGHLDGWVTAPNGPFAAGGPLEIKAPGSHMIRQIKKYGLPDYWQLQGQHYLALFPEAEAILYAIFDCDAWEPMLLTIPRHEPTIQYLRNIETAFWLHVVEGTPPQDTLSVLPPDMPQHPTDTSVIKIATPEWIAAVEEYRTAEALSIEADNLLVCAKSALLHLMNEAKADAAEGGGLRVYNREQKGRKTVDREALNQWLRQHGQDLAAFEKQGAPFKTFRTYDIKAPGDKP